MENNRKTALLACEMMKQEVERSLEHLGLDYDIIWVEPGLHNVPEKLHGRLQELLDENAGSYERFILVMGQCGNATHGLKTGDYEIIIPRVDDCISILLGSFARRIEIGGETPTFFVTQGWVDNVDGNILSEYKRVCEKYGEDMAAEIMEMMVGNYKRIGILDTGCYDISDVMGRAEEMAQVMNLKTEILPAGVDYIEKLFRGPWEDDGEFVVASPNSELDMSFVGPA